SSSMNTESTASMGRVEFGSGLTGSGAADSHKDRIAKLGTATLRSIGGPHFRKDFQPQIRRRKKDVPTDGVAIPRMTTANYSCRILSVVLPRHPWGIQLFYFVS